MIIIPGPASQILGIKVAKLINAEIVQVKFKNFPDGEHYIKIENGKTIKNQEVILIQSTYSPQDNNLMELLMILDGLKSLLPRSIILIVPYLCYSRQDKRFLKGEPLTAEIVCKIIEKIGEPLLKKFLTVDIHSEKVLDYFSKKIEVKNLSAMPLFGKYFKILNLKDPCVIAPDEGALNRSKIVADFINADCNCLTKKRDLNTGEISIQMKDLSIKTRDVIFIDDIISTGGTMARAIKMAKNQGANNIYAVCTHPLLIQNAKYRILQAGAKEIIATDCIPSECSKISVAPLLADFLTK
ncbi:MAG: ribose-phosphate diphosphokinase [Candidatus Helarchaeota archaeon]|nr:ribose-phosphate diphosphokinase [Candidatus Helarchaeota archaeon]